MLVEGERDRDCWVSGQGLDMVSMCECENSIGRVRDSKPQRCGRGPARGGREEERKREGGRERLDLLARLRLVSRVSHNSEWIRTAQGRILVGERWGVRHRQTEGGAK